MIFIRQEEPGDAAGIRTVLERAFPRPAEADLVDLLRQSGKATLSFVAFEHITIVGHILFSPVSLEPEIPRLPGLGLGPVAVLPEYQRQGIGSRLVRLGLAASKKFDYAYLVVLGHPAYYHRFGFQTGSKLGLCNEYGVQDEFMALELCPGALNGVRALVRYAPEFRETGC
jgi:putative acetyltransferase